MITQSNTLPNNVYVLNPDLTVQQLIDAANACLCKAEALAVMAVTTEFEAYTMEITNNYLWALSDTVREAKFLYERANIKALGARFSRNKK